MTSYSNIIRIGNSNGIIIPAKLLRALSLNEKDTVSITEFQGGLLLRKEHTQKIETPFSALDRWNEEHGYQDESTEDVLKYVENIREMRVDKDCPKW